MKILVATDFSPAADSAARSAARLARKLGDSILLLHVVQPPAMMYVDMGAVGADLLVTIRKNGEEALQKAVSGLSTDGLVVEGCVLVGGADEMIASCAASEKPRLVIMGTQGRGATKRLFLGSVAERTALSAPCPVLVVRAGKEMFERWLAAGAPLRVTVAVDKGSASLAALTWVRELQKAGPCDVTLVHEYWPPAEYVRLGLPGPRDLAATDPAVVAVLERELREHFKDLCEGATLRIAASWGRISDTLAHEADENHSDLLVMGTHQPHGWDRLKTGSAAIAVLRAATLPVLCVPEGNPPQAVASGVAIPSVRSLLVATDFSADGDAAIPHAYGLLGRNGGMVDLCHVHERTLPTPTYVYDNQAEALPAAKRTEWEARLRALIPAAAEARGIGTRIHVIDGGDAADGILQTARRLGADAVVVGSHGKTGLRRALMGSVALAVIQGSDKPVYVVKRQAS